jgi:hypothetical protein
MKKRKEKSRKMSLFKRKITLEEILEGIAALSPEEKSKVQEKLTGEDPAEETAPEAAPSEASEPDQIDEASTIEETPAPEEAPTEAAEESSESASTEAAEPEITESTDSESTGVSEENKQENENYAVMIKELTDRVNAFEAQLSALNELKAQMDEYVSKQRESFGYKSNVQAESDDIDNMSADELKSKILNG